MTKTSIDQEIHFAYYMLYANHSKTYIDKQNEKSVGSNFQCRRDFKLRNCYSLKIPAIFYCLVILVLHQASKVESVC